MPLHVHLTSVLAVAGCGVMVAVGCVKVTPDTPSHPRPVPLSTNWNPSYVVTPPVEKTGEKTVRTREVPTPLETETAFAMQLRLDRAGFSPGCIDGHWGPKSAAALAAWQESKGLAATGEPDGEAVRSLGSIDGIWTGHVVTKDEHDALRPFPASWTERSRLDSMGFSTIRETVAEAYHLSETALVALNPGVPWPNPPAGTVLKVPDVRTRALPAVQRIEIRIGAKTVRAYDGDGRMVAQFPCSIAANRAKRPIGQTLHVGVCADWPEYTFDPELFSDDPNAAGITKRLRIPPGPNNPVGLAWIGLDLPGYGIHGTPVPEKISHTESHGCFRLTNWDAQRLLRAVRTGVPVEILP